MIWIVGLLAVIACAVCAMAGAAEDKNTQDTAQIANKTAAKRPEALVRIFSEEFPDFAGQLTFAKADEAIRNWGAVLQSSQYTAHLKMFDKTKFKNDWHQKKAIELFVENVARPISPEFHAYATENPVEFYTTMSRALTSSQTLAQGE